MSRITGSPAGSKPLSGISCRTLPRAAGPGAGPGGAVVVRGPVDRPPHPEISSIAIASTAPRNDLLGQDIELRLTAIRLDAPRPLRVDGAEVAAALVLPLPEDLAGDDTRLGIAALFV